MAKISFFGAAGTVTGSCFLLQGNTSGILIDMGMFQGPPELEKLNRQALKFNAQDLTGVLLTHAHLDHCGRLPLLVKTGYKGPIFMTRATRELTELSLLDSAKIAQEHGNGMGEPLYSEEEVEELFELFQTTPYDENFRLGEFEVTYRDAGHILGSASIELVDQEGKVFCFSGDLGNTPQNLIKPTRLIEYTDIVVMESTYGDKTHPKEDSKLVIKNEINAIESTPGTLLIPAFSLERTQELLHIIHHLKLKKEIKQETPVYLDSPMAQKATIIFKRHHELYNTELSTDTQTSDPFSFPGLQFVSTHSASQVLKDNKGPQVIIAGSGMMNGGRIASHAQHFLPLESTRLLIVGYQAEGTLGREIMEGKKEVNIYGQKVSVRANITEAQGLSSHADQPRLINWLENIKGVKKVILVHGEDLQRKVLEKKIKSELKLNNITLTKLEESITF